MPAVNKIAKTDKVREILQAIKTSSVQKLSPEAQKAHLTNSERMSEYETAALWISNVYQKEIVSVPVFQDGKIVALSNTKRKWQICFNNNVLVTKIIMQGSATTEEQRSSLLAAYLSTVRFTQFHSFEQCQTQSKKIALALYPQNIKKAQETLHNILLAIYIGIHNHATSCKIPTKNVSIIDNSGPHPKKRTFCLLKPLFNAIEKRSPYHRRTTAIFNQLVKSAVGTPFAELTIQDSNQTDSKPNSNELNPLEILANVAIGASGASGASQFLTHSNNIDLNL